MSYLRVNAFTEYDPINRTIRQDGQERPAGFSALGFTFLEEVQQQLGTPMVRISAETHSETPWSVSNGPRDTRDELPCGGGQVCQSGAPLITPNAAPAGNQYHYTGPAASNPYFTTPSNPLREGYVLGFDKWFEQGFVSNPQLGGAPFAMNPLMTANEDGANEALRLIRMFEPNARLESSTFGSGGGPYLADRGYREIVLPDGARLNAGTTLNRYYRAGQGVAVSSDMELLEAIASARKSVAA
jgi:hypothetical protein